MISHDEVKNWWLELSEEQRADIYMNENPEATDQDWSTWWYYMTNDEQELIYEENIADTSNEGIDLEDYKSDFLHDKKREIERGI
jgi:hypothetical protein